MYEVNQEKRNKFIEIAGKRVNNAIHNLQILEPMANSNSYDYTKEDAEEMFIAIQTTVDMLKEEFLRKFEKGIKKEKNSFSFNNQVVKKEEETEDYTDNNTEDTDEIIENENNYEGD